MECSGTLLGAWVHSHPGVGSTATWPSEIDTTQHKKWIRDYHPNLVSIVMVENGYFRCFGQAIESGQIALRFQGTGVIQEEEEHVYRLTQEA
jgi:proteasome lid subunit RPN8/RPN11